MKRTVSVVLTVMLISYQFLPLLPAAGLPKGLVPEAQAAESLSLAIQTLRETDNDGLWRLTSKPTNTIVLF